MSFLAPAAFTLAALIPIIIAMYLLRLRRTEQVVSSVYLWRRMVRDVEANAPWQRLRRNLLLIVQLLALAALILALARPFTWTEGGGGQAAIVILDTSASMAASDAVPDRLGAAREQALGWVDGLPEDVRVTVIAASDGAQVLVSSSQDRRQIRQAIQGATVGDPGAGSGVGSDLTAALELASALSARQPDTEIVIYSDGRVTLPERMALKGTVRYLPVGVSGNNQAISVLSLRAMPGGGLTVFAQVTNYDDVPVQRRLALYAGDARQRSLVNAYDLDIPPGEQRAVVADDLPLETQVVEAQLSGEDALALDDRAWAVYRTGAPAQVTLVTEGNLFLETGLSLLANLEVTTVRPEDWETGKSKDGKIGRGDGDGLNLPTFQPARLTIFDAYVPVTATLPSGSLLFIAPPRSTEVFSVTGRIDQPVPRAVASAGDPDRDPLLLHVDFQHVSVLEAARVSMPIWARPVIVGGTVDDSTPLLWAGERDGQRVAVLAFDLRRSDLPLQVAFPVLLANLASWLAPAGGSDLPTVVPPGTVLSLALPPDIEPADVRSAYAIRPDGSQAQLAVEGRRAILSDTRQLGVYEIRWDANEAALVAVNLFSTQESDIRPAGNLPVTGMGPGAGAEVETGRTARREWWRALAFVALGLLVAEWLVYHRATLARLWASLKRDSRAFRDAGRQT
jgi:Ca-activated chloride channel family protein